MHRPPKIRYAQTALYLLIFSGLFATSAEAQRYNGRCGQPPREPFCVTKRNPDDRQIQNCQSDLRNYGRDVENYSRCLNNEGRRAEKDLGSASDQNQGIQEIYIHCLPVR